MDATTELERDVKTLAIGRVLDYLHRSHKQGRTTFPLSELADATALDPITAEQVMQFLESTGPFTVTVAETDYGELRWNVRGSPYELDGWKSDVWNC